MPVNYLPNGSDELLVGRAGYICGALLLNRKFGEVGFLRKLNHNFNIKAALSIWVFNFVIYT